jgi:hypothetical protein
MFRLNITVITVGLRYPGSAGNIRRVLCLDSGRVVFLDNVSYLVLVLVILGIFMLSRSED